MASAISSAGIGATVETGEIADGSVTYAKVQAVAANKILGSIAGGTVEEIDCTAAGRTLIDDADATAQRATLGLVIGTNVQAWDSDLDTLASSGTSGTGAFARVSAPALTAPTTDTLQTSGNVGIGVAPSATNGERILARQDGNQATLTTTQNTDTGTGALAQTIAKADSAQTTIIAHGSGRVVLRCGQTLGSWSELLSTSVAGLLVDTNAASPLVLGSNGQSRTFMSGTAKTLTESAATAVADVSLADNTVISGSFHYAVEANDATDYQCRRGEVPFVAVSKAGTITTALGTPVELPALSAGTLGVTPTVTTGAAKITLNLNAVSSLTQTILRASWRVMIDGGSGNVVAV